MTRSVDITDRPEDLARVLIAGYDHAFETALRLEIKKVADKAVEDAVKRIMRNVKRHLVAHTRLETGQLVIKLSINNTEIACEEEE